MVRTLDPGPWTLEQIDKGLDESLRIGWSVNVAMGRRLDGSRDRRTRQRRTKAEAERAERAWLVEKEWAGGKSCGRITLAELQRGSNPSATTMN